MNCANWPQGPPEPVALRTGGLVHLSRPYLIAIAVIGVAYLLCAFYSHDRKSRIGDFVISDLVARGDARSEIYGVNGIQGVFETGAELSYESVVFRLRLADNLSIASLIKLDIAASDSYAQGWGAPISSLSLSTRRHRTQKKSETVTVNQSGPLVAISLLALLCILATQGRVSRTVIRDTITSRGNS